MSTDIKKRGQSIEGAIAIGSEVDIETDDFGIVSGMAWIPNFNVPSYSGIGIVENIAALYALNELRMMRMGIKTTKPSTNVA